MSERTVSENNKIWEAAKKIAEQAVSEKKAESEEERRKHKKRIIKICLLMLLIVLIMIFASIAWFAMNKQTGADGMGVKIKGKSFDLLTMSSDDTGNNKGAYYDPYHQAIHNDDSQGYDVWLVDSSSNVNNYASSGTDPKTLGIEPGSHGVISFYIRPYRDVTVDLAFQTIGYKAQTSFVNEQQVVTMTALSSEPREPACYLNGHVLLFEGKTGNHYNGLIPTDENGKRKFSRTFAADGSFDTDTNGDGTNDAYKVDIYWVWAETLDTLVYNENSSAVLLCDKDAAAAQGEVNDYTKVVNNICEYPQYYLNGYSQETTYTEQTIVGRNAMYNDADQEIGMNVEYVLLRLETGSSSGE